MVRIISFGRLRLPRDLFPDGLGLAMILEAGFNFRRYEIRATPDARRFMLFAGNDRYSNEILR